MLMRTGKLLGMSAGTSITFTDAGDFASWAKEGIAFVSSISDATNSRVVMGGTGGGKFSPKSSYTREQAYITVNRLFNAK